jgi:FixJ family two-component response regulator
MTATSQPIVAVVDDDPRIRESLESLIESAGMRARAFSLAQDFLHGDLFAEASCLVTDVRMPGMDGLDLQRRVRLERPELPVIFITAHYDDKIEQCVFAQGAAFLVRKPLDPDELLRAIKLALCKLPGDNEKAL